MPSTRTLLCRLTRLLALAGVSVFGSVAAGVSELRAEALRHGYIPATGEADTLAGAMDPKTPEVFVKVIEPRRKAAVLSVAAASVPTDPPYSVVTYEIDCGLGAIKYSAIQTLDAQWQARPSGLSLPKTVWHRPASKSAPAQALRLACG